MIKIINSTFCLFFVIALINTGHCQQNISTLPQKVKEVEDSIFIIYTIDKNNKLISQGSGFFINSSALEFISIL